MRSCKQIMKLIDALKIAETAKHREGELFSCFVVAGLNPLHLIPFLTAELSYLFPDQRIEVRQGLYGDFPGNLERLANSRADSAAIIIEWADLDPRLGIRSSIKWSASLFSDIIATARGRAAQIQQAIENLGPGMPVALCMPTLPLLPVSFAPGWQSSSFEIELKEIIQRLTSSVCKNAFVRILSSQRLDLASPLGERFDIESELATGFPYRLAHASKLSRLLAQLTRKPSPKKGLITDLDDTMWSGILGEVGVEGISWDLDHGSQMHAFYQRLLGALASEGTLIGIASKNDCALVEQALARKDLALSSTAIFPVETHWGPKSESASLILKTWNIGPDSVVFVDDSPLELAEVKASHPEIECLCFPTRDNKGIYELTLRLRDLFGKDAILEEDTIRAESIRRSHCTVEISDGLHTTQTAFMESIHSEVSFNFSKAPLDPRALELVNKTNQFNLNGKRYTEASWHHYVSAPATFLLIVSYADKYGPLGKIAVLAGRQAERTLVVDTWVMSCRAFSRQIEHRCLDELFSRFDVDRVEFAYAATDRNGPLQGFLNEVLGTPPFQGCRVERSKRCLQQSEQVTEVTYE